MRFFVRIFTSNLSKNIKSLLDHSMYPFYAKLFSLFLNRFVSIYEHMSIFEDMRSIDFLCAANSSIANYDLMNSRTF